MPRKWWIIVVIAGLAVACSRKPNPTESSPQPAPSAAGAEEPLAAPVTPNDPRLATGGGGPGAAPGGEVPLGGGTAPSTLPRYGTAPRTQPGFQPQLGPIRSGETGGQEGGGRKRQQ